jgi:hypothetical protein
MMAEPARMQDLGPRAALLFAFCRMQLPAVALPFAACDRHLERTFGLFRSKVDANATWPGYLDHLYPVDWFLASACLEGDNRAWEALFAARAGRSDCLLLDALRARAIRLYPRDEEKQDSAVTEFWTMLVVADAADRLPILGRYDGQRPLVPWLIRVFQNWHISQLRKGAGAQSLPEDDLAQPSPQDSEPRWREAFTNAARDWLDTLDEQAIVLLGGQVGTRIEGNFGRLSLALAGKIALGVNDMTLDVSGLTTRTDSPTYYPAGVLANTANVGRYRDSHYAFVPEGSLAIGWWFTPNLRLKVGYNVLYMSDVIRPGSHISNNVNPSAVPVDQVYGSTPVTRTSPLFQRTDFWAEGITFGFDFRY